MVDDLETDLFSEAIISTTTTSSKEENVAAKMELKDLLSLANVLGFNEKEIATISEKASETTDSVKAWACELIIRWKDAARRRGITEDSRKQHLASALLSDEVSREDLADMLLQTETAQSQ